MPSCAVATCTNTDKNQQVRQFSFHKFPKERTVKNVWLLKCRRKDKFNISNAVICSDHFEEEQFIVDNVSKLLNVKGKRKIKIGAIPTLNLPLQTVPTKDFKRLNRVTLRNKPNPDSSSTSAEEEESTKEIDPDCKLSQADSPVINALNDKVNKLEMKTTMLDMQVSHLLLRNDSLSEEVRKLKSTIKAMKQTALRKKYVSDKLPVKLQSVFSPAQLKKLSGQERVYWSAEDIAKSLSICAMSKRAYETLRDVWKLPLPCPSTSRRWTQDFECKRGIMKEIVALMKEEAHGMDTYKRLCVVNFDEMNLSSNLQLDPSSDTIIGPHKNAQVVIVNGLCKKWRQPIFYDFDQNMTKTILFEIIGLLEEAGYFVCAVVNDLGGSNRGLWKDLGVDSKSPSFANPSDSTRNIWVFADAPHMLKLIRNHLLDDGWYLSDGTLVNKTTLRTMIAKDNAEIKLCPKLTAQLLEVTGAERMKVSSAAKIFSNHTAVLSKFCFPNQSAITNFFKVMDDYFDIFNSRMPSDHSLIRGAYGFTLIEQDECLQHVIQLVSTMRPSTKSKKVTLQPRKSILPCQHGIIGSIHALQQLLIEIRMKFNVSYIITRRLTQDPLENLFSIIRALGRTNDNPTPTEFKNRLKLILLGSRIKMPSNTNILTASDIDGHYYMSTKLFEYVRDLEADVQNEDDNRILELFPLAAEESILRQDLENPNVESYTPALKYIAGYIAFVLKKKHWLIFGTHTKDIGMRIVDQQSLEQNWILELSRGGLIEPDDELVSMIGSCDDIFRRFCPIETMVGMPGITEKLIRLIKIKHTSFDRIIVQEFVKTRLKIRVKYLNAHKELCKLRSTKRGSGQKLSKNAKRVKQFI